MSYLEDLIGNYTSFQVQRSEEGASLRPISSSDTDLDAFQTVAGNFPQHKDDGCRL
jgi:hypothetical protein